MDLVRDRTAKTLLPGPGIWLTWHACAQSIQGSLDTYRFCDEVWTFLIKNVSFKMENGGQPVMADKVKIVSCNAKRPGDQ